MSEVTISIRLERKDQATAMTRQAGGEAAIDVTIPVQRAEFARPEENTDEPLKPQRVYEAGIELRNWQRDMDTLTDLGAFAEGLVHEAAKAVGLEATTAQADIDSLRQATVNLIDHTERLEARSHFANRRLDVLGAPASEEDVRAWEERGEALSREAPAAFRDEEEVVDREVEIEPEDRPDESDGEA